jgi:SOS-response transcriptional repressor LexA
VNNILKRIKKAYRLDTDAEVADFLGIKPSTLSMQKNRGSLNLQRIIERCSDLNKNWLLDGKGKMRQKDQQSTETNIPVYSSLEIEDQNPDLHKSIKAGTLYADVTDELRFFSSSDHIIGYVVSENNKLPTLSKNDIAIVNLDDSPKEGDIFLILSDEEIYFRRMREQAEAYSFKNGKAQENSHKYQSGATPKIIGRVVWVLRRV